jgi:heptaprenyl diphosphate synthase/octaprenyl-diphosphate synthase
VTLPGLLLIERHPQDNPIKRFFTARRDREARLQEAIAMIRETGVLDTAMDMARDYIRRAEDAIAALPDTEARRCLMALGGYNLGRSS